MRKTFPDGTAWSCAICPVPKEKEYQMFFVAVLILPADFPNPGILQLNRSELTDACSKEVMVFLILKVLLHVLNLRQFPIPDILISKDETGKILIFADKELYKSAEAEQAVIVR